MFTRHLVMLLVPTLGLALASPAFAQDGRQPDGNLSRGKITGEAQKAIEGGLAWLAANQHQDGSWGTGQFNGNVAITSLGGLAFLAGGHQPGRGKYGKVVSRAVEYVLSQEDKVATPGFLNNGRAHLHGPMYNHGFATLFLAEVYGMGQSRRMNDQLKDTLDRAVKLILKSQNHEGGWRYRPQPMDADISVTICQIMALRAARNAGFSVPKSTADKCIEYVKQCQDVRNSGGFSYQRHGNGGFGAQPGFARTAAGVVALYSAGLYEGENVQKGLDYLMKFKPSGNNMMRDQESRTHYYYGHYYAAQAMWTAGGRYWHEWYPAIRDELLRMAANGGHRRPGERPNENFWSDNTFCSHYCSGMALIILQIPNNYLPIFQR